MPAAIAAVATFLAYAAGAAALSTALSYGIRALTLQKPKAPRAPSHNLENLRQTSRSNVAPSRIVYGTARISGVLAFAESVNAQGERVDEAKILHIALALCEGPVHSIRDIELGDDDATSTRYTNKVLFVPFVGTRDQQPLDAALTVGGTPVRVPKAWADGAHRLRGVAYLWGVLLFDQVAFPAGAPNIRCTIQGRRVYDPRDAESSHDDEDTWQWTQNPALCVLDYMTSKRYGLGLDLDQIDLDSVKAAADVCDESIAVSIAGNDPNTGLPYEVPDGTPNPQPRYTINGVFETSGKRGDILDGLLNAMAGSVYVREGVYTVMAGTTRVTTFHLAEDDLAGELEVVPGPNRIDRVNTVRGTYVSREKNWLPDDFMAQTSEAFKQEDGGEEHATEIDLAYCADWFEATRHAQIHLKRARRGMSFRWPAKLTALGIERGDVGTISVDWLGLSNYPVVVDEWECRGEEGIILTLGSYRSDEYDYSAQPLPARPLATSLPSPWVVAAPPDVTATAITVQAADGSISAGFRLSISPAEGEAVAVERYRIRYRHHDDTTWQVREASSGTVEIWGLRGGEYLVEVVAINRAGFRSDPTTVSVMVSSAGELPAAVSWFGATYLAAGGWRFVWYPTAAESLRHAGYRIKYKVGEWGVDAEAEWFGATMLGFSAGTARDFTTTRLQTPGQTYTVYIRSVDLAGRESATTVWATLRPPIPAPSQQLLVEIDAAEEGWPGDRVNARLMPDGWLESPGVDFWGNLPATWAEWTLWARNARTLMYRHPEIDLGRDVSLEPSVWLLTSSGTDEDNEGVDTLMRARLDDVGRPDGGSTYGTFEPLHPVTARYVQFAARVKRTAAAPVPQLREMRMRLSRYALSETIDDVRVGAQGDSQSIQRREANRWQLGQGIHRNTALARVSDSWWLTIDEAASVQLTAGSSHKVVVPDVAKTRLTRGWTLELQVAADAQNGKWLLSKNGSTDYALKWTSGTELAFLGTGVPTGAVFPWSSSWGWRHVAVTHDGATLRGYLDGVEQFALPWTGALVTSSGELWIGGSTAGTGYASATVEELRLWNYSRPAADITATIDAELEGTEQGLVGYWRMDEGSGSTAADRAADAADATVSGAWALAASRYWPEFDLGGVRWLEDLRLTWGYAVPTNTQIVVQVSDDAATWYTVSAGDSLKNLSASWVAGGDGLGKRVYVRAWLTSSDVSVRPRLGQVTLEAQNVPTHTGDDANVGDFTVIPTRDFATIDLAQIVAVQDSPRPLSWSVMSRQPYAVRFQLWDGGTWDGSVTSTVRVDVNLQGGAPPAA